MLGQTVGTAIYNNDIGTLKRLLNQNYYSAKYPTMSEQMVENAKLMCIYSGKSDLLPAFEKYTMDFPLNGFPARSNNPSNFSAVV